MSVHFFVVQCKWKYSTAQKWTICLLHWLNKSYESWSYARSTFFMSFHVTANSDHHAVMLSIKLFSSYHLWLQVCYWNVYKTLKILENRNSFERSWRGHLFTRNMQVLGVQVNHTVGQMFLGQVLSPEIIVYILSLIHIWRCRRRG